MKEGEGETEDILLLGKAIFLPMKVIYSLP